MNNVIKILIYLLVALLLVSWLITVGKSCTNNEEGLNETMVERVDRADSARDLMEELEGDTADFSQELESILDEEEAAASESDETDFTTYEEPEPDPVVQKTPEKKAQPKKAAEPVREQTKPKASGPGTFLVVAGSYLVPDNANAQRDKLRSLGYNAEVVSFELSEYHTVLAGRYDDYDRAQSTVNSLSGDGIDAYVKKRTR